MEQLQKAANELTVVTALLNAHINKCAATSHFIKADGYIDIGMLLQHGEAMKEVQVSVEIFANKVEQLNAAINAYASKLDAVLRGYSGDAT